MNTETAKIADFRPLSSNADDLKNALVAIDSEISSIKSALSDGEVARNGLLSTGTPKEVVNHDVLLKEAKISLAQFEKLRKTTADQLRNAEEEIEVAEFLGKIEHHNQLVASLTDWKNSEYVRMQELLANGVSLAKQIKDSEKSLEASKKTFSALPNDDRRRKLFAAQGPVVATGIRGTIHVVKYGTGGVFRGERTDLLPVVINLPEPQVSPDISLELAGRLEPRTPDVQPSIPSFVTRSGGPIITYS
ncbi:hypothetical protein JRX38_06015 [Gluconobacter cerinus]|uniref:hypothetical protein n=1 Tax=Gluconobacter cerinus TaxID=38307 RepID=UPI00193FC0E4|nr:hypothetical protein [Gluconobacter cerinus]MBM3097577.1 hypothetical protein [Gluconobacter cerinus]